jgi:hypothetical protein
MSGNVVSTFEVLIMSSWLSSKAAREKITSAPRSKKGALTTGVSLVVLAIALACSDAVRQPLSPSAGDIPGPVLNLTKTGNGPGACLLQSAIAGAYIQNVNSLECTSNDVDIAFAKVTLFSVNGSAFAQLPASGKISCVPGDSVRTVTSAIIANNASERYDFGLWINPSGSAYNTAGNACLHFNLIPGQNKSTSIDLTPDACGDIASTVDTVEIPLDTLHLVCPSGGVSNISVDACAAWSNGTTGSNDRICPKPGVVPAEDGFRFATTPGTTAKCRCEPLLIPIDVKGSLQIVKRVVNDNGGTLTVSDFNVNSSAASLTFGSGVADGANTLKYSSQVITVDSGSYTLRENDVANYTEGTWSCTGATPTNNTISAGAVVVKGGDNVVCTITNNDNPGSLQIVKRVVNDNGGTATVAAFGLASTAGSLTFGSGVADGANTLKYSSQVISVSAGSYTLRENDIAGY